MEFITTLPQSIKQWSNIMKLKKALRRSIKQWRLMQRTGTSKRRASAIVYPSDTTTLHSCFICEYAYQRSMYESEDMCAFCPVNWVDGSNGKSPYKCEDFGSPYEGYNNLRRGSAKPNNQNFRKVTGNVIKLLEETLEDLNKSK